MMTITPVPTSQVATYGRPVRRRERSAHSGIFGALGDVIPNATAWTGPAATDVIVDALPATCPDCPANVSCAPCNPFSCPAAPADAPGGWHQWVEPTTSKMKCVRSRAPSEAGVASPGYMPFSMGWMHEHQTLSVVVFGAGLLAVGVAVAYASRHNR